MSETRYEKVASVVVELGQRFYPSEVAFPIEMLTDMLVNYSFEQQSSQTIPLAWATRTMLLANSPPQIILDVFLGLLDTRRNPCHSDQGFTFVLNEVAVLLEIWVEEILGISPQSIGIRDVKLNFSAQRVDEIISSLLLHSPSSVQAGPKGGLAPILHPEKVKTKLKTVQDLIRRSF